MEPIFSNFSSSASPSSSSSSPSSSSSSPKSYTSVFRPKPYHPSVSPRVLIPTSRPNTSPQVKTIYVYDDHKPSKVADKPLSPLERYIVIGVVGFVVLCIVLSVIVHSIKGCIRRRREREELSRERRDIDRGVARGSVVRGRPREIEEVR